MLKPLADSKKGVALGCAANPRYGRLDPGAMAEAVIDEALRNVVAAGGDPARTAILDNFSWGNCDKPDRLGSLVLARRGCYAAAVAYGTPFISGKDSLNNEYRVGDETLSIPPTLFVSALSIVPDVARVVSMDAKRAGNLVMLVGATRAELGRLRIPRARSGRKAGRVPSPRPPPRRRSSSPEAPRHDAPEPGARLPRPVGGRPRRRGGGDVLRGAPGHGPRPVGRRPTRPFPPGYDRDATLLFSESCTRFLVEVEAGKKFPVPDSKLMGHICIPLGRVSSDRAG